jgi:surface antigen
MKKMSLMIVTATLVATTVQAQVSSSQFLCGVVGAVTGGTVTKKVLSLKDPAVIVASIMGGIVGVNFCQYLDNEEAQIVKQIADVAVNDESIIGERRTWRSTQHRGSITVTAQGYSKTNPGAEGLNDNSCLKFDTEVYNLNNQCGWQLGLQKPSRTMDCDGLSLGDSRRRRHRL